MDRLATAGIGIRDQVSTADFLSAMADRTFLVRAAISLVSEPIARVIVLDDLPSHNLIGRRVSHYGRVAFIETHIAGEVFTHWCDAGSGQVDGLTFVLPKVQEWATWERQPSHWMPAALMRMGYVSPPMRHSDPPGPTTWRNSPVR